MGLSPVLLDSQAVGTAAQWLANVPQGKYEALAAILTGTSAAAQALTEVNVGRVRLSETSRDLVNAEALHLRRVNSLKSGNQRRQFAVAGVTEYTLILPRGYYDNNVHRVLESDLAQLTITFGAGWATQIATANWKLYGLTRQTGQMRYNYKLTQIDLSIPGAGVTRQQIREENVVALYIERDPTVANIDSVRVEQDSEIAMSVVRFEDLNDISDALNATDSLSAPAVAADAAEGFENNSSNIAEVQLANPGDVGEFLSDDVLVEVTAAAAATLNTLSLIVASCDFSPTKLRETQFEERAVFQRKLARKNRLNRTRPLQALRIASEG